MFSELSSEPPFSILRLTVFNTWASDKAMMINDIIRDKDDISASGYKNMDIISENFLGPMLLPPSVVTPLPTGAGPEAVIASLVVGTCM